MFAVYGQDPRAMGCGRCQKQLPRRNQAFLICQGQRCALFQRRKSRRDARRAYNGRHDPIGRARCGLDQRGLACGGLNPRLCKCRFQIRKPIFIGGYRNFGTMCDGIPRQLVNIAPARKCHNPIGIRGARDQIEGVLPDGASGPKNTDTAHLSNFPLLRWEAC